MKAMILERPRSPLRPAEMAVPVPRAGQVLLSVGACGVCRTDLHLLDGELPAPRLPVILGHQIVGTVAALGPRVGRYRVGDRVGVPWLGWTCGECRYCRSGQENLCDQARFTGCHIDGGFAQYAVADERFCFPVPQGLSDVQAAPLGPVRLRLRRAHGAAGGARRGGRGLAGADDR